MKKNVKKMLAILLATAIAVTTLAISPFSALAVDTAKALESSKFAVWADPSNVLSQQSVTNFSTDKLATLGGVNPFKRSTSSSKYYLFLPSNTDCTALKFWFDTSSTLTIDGTSITSGEPTDIFASINEGGVSKDCTFRLGSTNYSVTVIKSGDVGTVYVDTNSGSLSTITNNNHTGEEPGSIMVVQPDGKVDYMGVMDKMSGRGNGTWSTSTPKLPYNVKLAKSTSLLGMPAAKKWCLLANYGDSSLVKNQLTYDFAKYIGIKYQPTCKPVDLYVNQQYLGSYQLAEKVEIKSNRINIDDAYENLEIANGSNVDGVFVPADLSDAPAAVTVSSTSTAAHTVGKMKYSTNQKGTSSGSTGSWGSIIGGGSSSNGPALVSPDDITGGYLYELEISNRWPNEKAGFCAYNRQGWVMKSCDVATKDMVEYSYNLLYALGAAVYNGGTVPSGATTTSTGTNSRLKSTDNPAPAEQYRGKRWSDILDADSAVKYYWTQEFFKNMDSSTSSTYFYKDSDTKDTMLYAGPMWDMDNSIGYNNGTGTRWGCTWTEAQNWYTKKARIYRFYYNDSSTSYSTDAQSPLNFYAALATNCTDFWSLAEKYWYTTISPAVQIIRGEAEDPTGTLKSAAYYINTVAKSGTMNNLRHNLDNDSTFNTAYHIDGMTSWFTNRQTWINGQFTPVTLGMNTVIASIDDQTYTGKEIKPEANVILNGTYLQDGLDYTTTYENNVNAGTANVTITGNGYYVGEKSTTFTINKATLGNITLPAESYSGMTLTAEAKDVNGNALYGGVSYQWCKNGTPIADATSSTYTVAPADVGSQLTVIITGDDDNVQGTVTSSVCSIQVGVPDGYIWTIASWDYNYTEGKNALATADPDNLDYYYSATSGKKQDTAILKASVDAQSNSKLKWSGADAYTNSECSVSPDQSPVMSTSKTDGIGWGSYPYFVTSLSTAGYGNITFSARLGGTKKGPRDWKLQYSLDGNTYTDIQDATYSIKNNKAMELAFDNVALPEACDNQLMVYIRMVVSNDIAINGSNTIVNQTSGDAAVNNIHITGSLLANLDTLYAPSISIADGSRIFDDNLVALVDNNAGAELHYTINGGTEQIYTSAFAPFDAKTAKLGDTATVVAYAKQGDIESDAVTATYTFNGVDVMSFSYSTYTKDVVNGAVQSSGGVYDESGRMTAYADSSTQYVPLWNNSNRSFTISPDDGVKWSNESGFTYKTSTAGYENITFTCKAYTTAQGPRSITLQYSTDGLTYYNVKSNQVLPANGSLEDLFITEQLPQACNNKAVLFIRLVTNENQTNGGENLWNNHSKGNLYVNNVVIGGEDDGSFKMPYTNKSTDYFGDTGTVKYVSPDGMPMTYIVKDDNDNIVQSGTYPKGGISLASVKGFMANEQRPYTILIYVTEDEDESLINVHSYRYKGETIVKFNYSNSSTPFSDYVSADSLSVSSTGGVHSGTLSMDPGNYEPIALSYTGTYGVKVTYDENNYYYCDKILDDANDDGYWLIETSSLGYRGLTLNLEQLSSSKGPRDWGVAYSTNGRTYHYVDNSNVRVIDKDYASDTVETYGNLELPSACDNQEKLYIKIFINGGESVDGTELELVTSGNTGINNIEISGVRLERMVKIDTTVLEHMTDTEGSVAWAGVNVKLDGENVGVTDNKGAISFYFDPDTTHTFELSGNNIKPRSYTVTVDSNKYINAPLLIFEMNDDGIINAKDYAILSKDSRYSGVKGIFSNFINADTSSFAYAE